MICTSCGRSIDGHEGDMRFCPFCAAPLPDESLKMTPECFRFNSRQLRQQAREAFEAYCSTLEELYNSLLNSRNIMKRLTIPDIVSKDGSHKAYMAEIKAQIERAQELLKACPDDSASRQEARDLAYELTHLFLHGKTEAIEAGRWTLVACEHLTTPFFPYIERERMKELYEMFIAETPKHMSMPNERQLMKDMLARIEESDG